jgi:hypothetical protein
VTGGYFFVLLAAGWSQSIFGTAALSARNVLVLVSFPVIVWGSDEFWRRRQRSRHRAALRAPTQTRAAAAG